MNSEPIIERYKGKSGVEYIFEYYDADSFDQLDYSLCKQTYGVCFCGDDIVIGFSKGRKEWGLIGGTIEKGEKFEETFKREIKEEANMEVLDFLPIGYQKMTDTRDGKIIYQLRFVSRVRPFGPFELDPAGDIVEIKLINPADYKKYFDWGKIGERIIEKALELKEELV